MSLRALSLAGRGLDTLPPALFEHADTLEQLDLSGNRLTTLPDTLARLTRLRVLFASNNPIERLPAVLGACPALEQIGLRGCGLREVPAEALPARLRWLTLTDNRIETLPDALGQRPRLEKLMLAGNRLTRLPDTLAGAPALALIRLAANRLDALPGWLDTLPRLAWLAWAGNPCEARADPAPVTDAAAIPWSALTLGERLGEGASGHIHRAHWQPDDGGPAQEVAVKRFKGAMTSDGLPAHEMAACLAAGAHPHLTGALGHVTGVPDGGAALVMPLLPSHWRALAAPPSLASCSRDVYPDGWRVTPPVLRRLALAAGTAAAHLHARGLLHGDLYAHNLLWDGTDGQAVLSDFGAASCLPRHDAALAATLRCTEVRAWGLLLGELLAHADGPVPEDWRALQAACTGAVPSERPTLAEAVSRLQASGCA